MIRLNKYIALCGIASRRKADEMLLNGEFTLNGSIVKTPGAQIDPKKDILRHEGRQIKPKNSATLVYALYKPKNCVNTMHDPEGRSKISDFFPRSGQRLFPVGRLDYDSEGLVLITGDGELANRIMKPAGKIRKKYFVKIKGILSKADLRSINGKLTLEGKALQRMQVRPLHTVNDKTWLEVVLVEGRNRQIRKVFDRFNHRVLKIKRFQIGNIALENLMPGESRLLRKEEIEKLLQLCSAN